MAELANMDPDALRELANYRMPFGKYQGRLLSEIPRHPLLPQALGVRRLPDHVGRTMSRDVADLFPSQASAPPAAQRMA